MKGCELGIAATSYLSRWQTIDTLELLEKCHGFGAAGIHAVINGDSSKVRARAEELGMYVEAMVPLPAEVGIQAFEESLKAAQAAGATALRAACLGTRRYETFPTLEEWQAHVSASHSSLQAALPLLDTYKIPLGLENHKDWTSDELLSLLKTYSSEYFGVCLDFGNNISLMELPMETIEKLAPYTVTTHLKDIAVAFYDEGILLSEVILGQGLIDLKRAVELIQSARPQAHMNLEMITRDPLQVPMRREGYLQTFSGNSEKRLAAALEYVNTNQAAIYIAESEDENVRDCLAAWKVFNNPLSDLQRISDPLPHRRT